MDTPPWRTVPLRAAPRCSLPATEIPDLVASRLRGESVLAVAPFSRRAATGAPPRPGQLFLTDAGQLLTLEGGGRLRRRRLDLSSSTRGVVEAIPGVPLAGSPDAVHLRLRLHGPRGEELFALFTEDLAALRDALSRARLGKWSAWPFWTRCNRVDADTGARTAFYARGRLQRHQLVLETSPFLDDSASALDLHDAMDLEGSLSFHIQRKHLSHCPRTLEPPPRAPEAGYLQSRVLEMERQVLLWDPEVVPATRSLLELWTPPGFGQDLRTWLSPAAARGAAGVP